jgi:hypothetical protein
MEKRFPGNQLVKLCSAFVVSLWVWNLELYEQYSHTCSLKQTCYSTLQLDLLLCVHLCLDIEHRNSAVRASFCPLHISSLFFFSYVITEFIYWFIYLFACIHTFIHGFIFTQDAQDFSAFKSCPIPSQHWTKHGPFRFSSQTWFLSFLRFLFRPFFLSFFLICLNCIPWVVYTVRFPTKQQHFSPLWVPSSCMCHTDSFTLTNKDANQQTSLQNCLHANHSAK